jgi:hypothetical protein
MLRKSYGFTPKFKYILAVLQQQSLMNEYFVLGEPFRIHLYKKNLFLNKLPLARAYA